MPTWCLHGAYMKKSFTTANVLKFAAPVSGYAIVWDKKTAGLGLRLTAGGSRSYVFERRLHGRTVRTTIGSAGAWELDAARAEARRLSTVIDSGVNPHHQAEAQAAAAEVVRVEEQRHDLILSAVWAAYVEDCKRFWGDRHYRMHLLLAARGGEIKKCGAGLTKPAPLASLMPLKLTELTAPTVAAWLRREVAKRATNAHQSFRLLKTFAKWADDQPAYAGAIPAGVFTHSSVTREIPASKAKADDCLQKEYLPAWFKAVRQVRNKTIAAYLQTLLLTGARRNELATLKRADVDFERNEMTIRDKVEGERTIPLTPFVSQLLKALPIKSEWMFAADSKSGRLMEPRIAHTRALVLAGLPHVSLHGLRRTFRTLSEYPGIPSGIVAQIMGHKPSAIAEKHYTRRSMDLLRQHHAALEAWILEQAGVSWAPIVPGRLGVVNNDGSVRATA